MISGKYFLIDQDERFPKTPNPDWMPLAEADRQEFPCIYLISGYGNLYVGMDSFGTRIVSHKHALIGNRHDNDYMRNTVNLHSGSLSGFFYQTLVKLPNDVKDKIGLIENSYIKRFDSYRDGFNMLEFSGPPSELNKGRKFTIISPEGEIISGNCLSSLAREYNLCSSSLSKVIDGKSSNHKGWRQNNEENRKPFEVEIFQFISPEGELIETTNLKKFCKENSLSYRNMRRVKDGERKHHKGWRKNHIDNLNKFIETKTKSFELYHPKHGIVKGKNISEFSRKYKLAVTNVSNVINGKVKTVKQWRLIK